MDELFANGGRTWFTYLFVACFGLLVGSFLNVVVARVPLRRRDIEPSASCPECGAGLAWAKSSEEKWGLEVVARCKACNARVSIAYPERGESGGGSVPLVDVVWRRSIVSPGSACPKCQTPIAGFDNIPVLSWLLLRGRCRHCGAPISAQYPLVEATCSVLFLVSLWRFGLSEAAPGTPPAPWAATLAAVLLASLLALAVIDMQTKKLPIPIVYTAGIFGIGLVLAASLATGEWGRLRDAAIAAVACGVPFYLMYDLTYRFSGKAGMGLGDVRLSVVLGLYLGWFGPRYVVVGMMAAFFFGAIVGVVLMALGKATRKTAVPFGVYLALGTLFSLLFAEQVSSWYLNLGAA